MEAENKVTNSYLSKIPFRQKLLKRLTELANYEKIGAPRKRHGKWYFYKNNGRWAAYSISRSGSDWQEFYVIDLKTGQLTNDCLSGGFQEHQAAVGHVRHMLMAKIQKLWGINCN